MHTFKKIPVLILAGGLARLASDCQLQVFQHEGFWQPMDFLRDKNELQTLGESGRAH